MPLVLVAAVTFLAIFTQTVSGFGAGLVAMALLPAVLDIRLAVPLVALVTFIGECLILLRFRHTLNIRAVARLSAAALLGIPVGLLALEHIDSTAILRVLGLFLAAYSVYALLSPRLPEIRDGRWAYGFGFVSGVLSGLYNTGGPPVVIYGTCRRWPPDAFRSNLQGFFIVNSIVVITGHALAQRYTGTLWPYIVAALPALAAGLVAGFVAARHIHPLVFRRLVFIVLLILGIRLLTSA